MTDEFLKYTSSVSIASALMVVFATPNNEAWAQVYFVQGEDGQAGERGPEGPAGTAMLDCDAAECTLRQNLVAAGHATFDSIEAESANIDTLDTDELTATMSFWLPECPSGYTRDRTCETCDQIVLCVRGRDEMVKVGDFWVDRYEASVWQNSDCTGTQYGGVEDNWDEAEGFPYHGSFSTPRYTCSVRDVHPARWITWFQAQSACAASGKSLLTNAEWQVAVAGTVDPGESLSDTGACRTGPRLAERRLTGRAGVTPGGALSCISYWGAEDMIGNLWEWVEDWYGQGGNSDDGSQPAEYFGDGYWNVDPALISGAYSTRFPASGVRGSDSWHGVGGGAFTMAMNASPSDGLCPCIGFRCAIH